MLKVICISSKCLALTAPFSVVVLLENIREFLYLRFPVVTTNLAGNEEKSWFILLPKIVLLMPWLLPENHNIYLKYKRSMFNTTISNLISTVSPYDLCSGITDTFAVNSNSYIKHIVPKKFV